MIKHIVLLKVLPNIDTAKVEQVLTSLGNLSHSSIPSIKEFSFGINNSPEGLAKGFNYAFIMQFESENERDLYLIHPEHIKVADQIKNMVNNDSDAVLVFDF